MNSDSAFMTATHMHSEDVSVDEGEEEFLLPEPSRLRCAEKFGFYVAPGGAVFPCSAGVGQPQLRIGQLGQDRAIDVIRAAATRPDLCQLRSRGPRPLYDRIVTSSAATSLRRGYLDPCDFHRHALTTPELARVVAEARP
jgi:hypothetical protein